MALNNLPDLNPALNPEAVKWGKDVAAAIRALSGEQDNQRSAITNATRAAEGATQSADSASQVATSTLTVLRAVPAAPADLAVSSESAGFGPNGLPVTTVVLTWDAVTTDDAGQILAPDALVTNYEVWNNVNTAPKMLGVITAANTDVETMELALDAGETYNLYVRGRTATVNGAFSEPLVHTAAAPTAVGLQPTAPTLETSLGVVSAKWDGMVISGGSIPKPNWIDYVYAEIGDTSSGPWVRTGQPLRAAGTVVTSAVPGDAVWVRFKSVTTAGVASDPSTTASIIVQGVDLGSLNEDVADAIEQANDAAEAAQTAANGKNNITRSADPASGSGTVAGDLWFQYLDGAVIGLWIWDGDSWEPQSMDGVVLTNLDAGSITAGFLASERIDAGTIGADQIAAGAVTAEKMAAGAVVAGTVAANTITGNEIVAGSITVSELEAGIGGQLNLSANESITFLVGEVETAQGSANAVASELEDMRTVYDFSNDGATISAPDSPFAVAIRNDRIEMLEASVPVSTWNAGQMHVESIVVGEIELGNHKIEKYGTGTVFRAL
jgi:hypothetical protein